MIWMQPVRAGAVDDAAQQEAVVGEDREDMRRNYETDLRVMAEWA